MTALVDVIIPACNAEATICSAIASIQHQTVQDIRINVVDDGSTDRTGALLAGIAAVDPRVTVYTQPNGGIVDALNFALMHCTAPFVARHDADDLAAPERLERQLAYLRDHPATVAVGAAVRHIDAEGRATGTFGRLGSPENADALFIPSREPYLVHPFLTVRRDALVRIDGYRYVYHAEDTDLYWRLRELGSLHNLPDVLGDYRIHDGSISGASIVNGRIQAIFSQLAAVSAQRRARGADDLLFPRDTLAQMKVARELSDMIDIAAKDLDKNERDWFDAAVSAKLLELAAYRPYEIESSDCAFIGTAVWQKAVRITLENERQRMRQLSGSAARLASKGRFGDARHLLTPRAYLPFSIRLVARWIFPARWLRALRRGSGPVK